MAAEDLVGQVRHAVAMPGGRNVGLGGHTLAGGVRIDEDDAHREERVAARVAAGEYVEEYEEAGR